MGLHRQYRSAMQPGQFFDRVGRVRMFLTSSGAHPTARPRRLSTRVNSDLAAGVGPYRSVSEDTNSLDTVGEEDKIAPRGERGTD